VPRKAPDNVNELRVTLGNYERQQLEQFIDSYQQDKLLENVPNLLIGASAVGYVAVFGLASYSLYKFLTGGNAEDLLEAIGGGTASVIDTVGKTIGVATPRSSAFVGKYVTAEDLQVKDGVPPNYVALMQKINAKYDKEIAALEALKEKLENKQDNVFTWRIYREAQIKTLEKQIDAAGDARYIELSNVKRAMDEYYANNPDASYDGRGIADQFRPR